MWFQIQLRCSKQMNARNLCPVDRVEIDVRSNATQTELTMIWRNLADIDMHKIDIYLFSNEIFVFFHRGHAISQSV